ncbi:MAG: hypothetical protein NVSMB52_18440 [Chloroflexota bacterium]
MGNNTNMQRFTTHMITESMTVGVEHIPLFAFRGDLLRRNAIELFAATPAQWYASIHPPSFPYHAAKHIHSAT